MGATIAFFPNPLKNRKSYSEKTSKIIKGLLVTEEIVQELKDIIKEKGLEDDPEVQAHVQLWEDHIGDLCFVHND